MRMRILGLFAVLLLLLPVGGCSEAAEEREYFDTPVLGQYYVEYKGRVYNTYGTPCRYDATLENTGYLGYRAQLRLLCYLNICKHFSCTPLLLA